MTRKTALFLTCLLAAGCGTLQRPATPVARVGLDPTLPQGGLLQTGTKLEVLPFASIPPFHTDRVVTRTGEGLWSLANYHRWLAEPGDLIAYHLGEYLARIDRYGAVLSTPGTLRPDIRISGAVRALYWDRERGEAFLEIEVSAAPAVGNGGLFQRYRTSRPVEGDEVQAYLRAASVGLSEVLEQVAADLRALE